MWGPREIDSTLIWGSHKSNNYGLLYANNYSIHGVYKPTYNLGAPHCIIISIIKIPWFLLLKSPDCPMIFEVCLRSSVDLQGDTKVTTEGLGLYG